MPETINAEKAMELAKGFLDKVNYAYYFIEEVKPDNNEWRISAATLANKIIVRISKTGELLELAHR